MDFVSFDDKNLQRWRKFVGEHDFPHTTLLTDIKFNVWVTAGTWNLWCQKCKVLLPTFDELKEME